MSLTDNFEIRRTYMALWRTYVEEDAPLHPDYYQHAVGYLCELGHIQFIGQHISLTEAGAMAWASELRRIAHMFSDMKPEDIAAINRLTGAKLRKARRGRLTE